LRGEKRCKEAVKIGLQLSTLSGVSSATLQVGRRLRAFVRVAGPGAEDYLQRIVSNDVAALSSGESCEALLLTPKARVIAPMRVLRRESDDFLLLTEPELGEALRAELVRTRFAARAEIEPETHSSYLLLGAEAAPKDMLALPNEDYGIPAWEILDQEPPQELPEIGEDALELLRIEAGRPRYGKEIDDRVLPAEAGLVERAVSLSKGCFPGQEPIARLHYRGHANRGLRVLEVDDAQVGAEIVRDGKVVGRVTSVAAGRVLAYVRTEVPEDAVLDIGGAEARHARMRPA
jgi:folate-binding protein YgfZ